MYNQYENEPDKALIIINKYLGRSNKNYRKYLKDYINNRKRLNGIFERVED